MLIDDFSKGPYAAVLKSPGSEQSYQSTGNPDCPVRRTILQASEGGPQQTASLDIGKGHLMLGTGALVTHALWILYGVDKKDKPHQLKLDLRKSKGIRFHFDFNNLNLNVTAEIVSDPGGAMLAQNIDAHAFGPFTCDFLFADFHTLPGNPPASMNKVSMIHFILQSGSTHGGNDYVIRKIELF